MRAMPLFSQVDLQQVQEIDYIPFPVDKYRLQVPLMISDFPEKPNDAITTYPDPSILPDRFAYGSSSAGLQPNFSVPLMRSQIPDDLAGALVYQDTSRWVQQKRIAAPLPSFLNSES